MVGGGAAGVYAAIQAKKLAPFLNVIIVEKGRLLSKVVTCLPVILCCATLPATVMKILYLLT